MSTFSIMGRKAEVVIEMEMRNGATLRVPVGDLATYNTNNGGLHTITLLLPPSLQERMYEAGLDAGVLGF